MSDNNYNPDNDKYLNHLKGLSKKKDELAKIDKTMSNVRKNMPLNKIKEDAKAYNDQKKKRKILIITSAVLVFALIAVYLLIDWQDEPIAEKQINIIKFADVPLNADINMQINGIADSLKQTNKANLFNLKLMNTGSSFKVEEISTIKDSIILKNYKVHKIQEAGDLIQKAIKDTLNDIIFIGSLPELKKEDRIDQDDPLLLSPDELKLFKDKNVMWINDSLNEIDRLLLKYIENNNNVKLIN